MTAHTGASDAVAGNMADATSLQPLPATTATQAVGSEEHHVDPTALGMNATAWVSLAMIVVILIMIWKKVPAIAAKGLDAKIAAIRAQLDEASQLRAEAEKLKAEYEAKQKAVEADTTAMIDHAKAEAAAIVAQARVDAAALIERRGKMAEDKIAAAERSAIAEVRARAASATAAAAAKLIAERHDATADKALVDKAIGSLGLSGRA
jgi:F-type H+-transporting ATPase subunit b